MLHPVKSYRAERKKNVLKTFLANEPDGGLAYGVKSNSSDTINCRDNLFIFCKAGVIQVARTLFGLIYGTWEAAYK